MSLEDAQAEFFAAPIGGFTCDDTLYGFPQEFNIEYGATLVNTDMAAAAGVDATGLGLMGRVQGRRQGDDGDEGRHDHPSGLPLHRRRRAAVLVLLADPAERAALPGRGRPAFTIDTPEAREALALMKSIVDEGIVDPTLFNDTENWVGDCYFEEVCAMGLVGPWVVTEYEADFPEVAAATQYVPLPTLGETPDFVADSGWGLTVSADSPGANVAWDFVEYATLDPENAAEWNVDTGTLPALRENAEGVVQEELIAAFPHFAPWFEILPYGQYVGNLPDRDLLWYEITYPHLLDVLQGGESVDDALAAMEPEANETFR